MLNTTSIRKPAYEKGLAIVTHPDELLRITHVFGDCLYAIKVRDPEYARYARRPRKFRYLEFEELISNEGPGWVKVDLPSALLLEPEEGTIQSHVYNQAWSSLEPLILELEEQRNLERERYTFLIRRHSEKTDRSFTSVYRLVIRYYYFGCDRRALLNLPPGPKPNENASSHVVSTEHRRGRQPTISDIRGPNNFVVTEDDISDMNAAAKRCARNPTFVSQIHIEYLAKEFHARHPEISTAYENKEIPEPVTVRQYRYYLKKHFDLSKEELQNIRTREDNPGFDGAHHAQGPGSIYEVDATGGRMHLRASDSEATPLRTAIIYLMIDRWSRYVVSAYISLKPASYEELKYALLVAFTSRVPRFPILGINVDDATWPRGVVCSCLTMDHGSELISFATMEAVTKSLHIRSVYMPVLNPDAKAIIERFIKNVKQRQASSGLSGSYMDRPSDPESRQRFEKAKVASVNTLIDAYRELIRVVTDHNNAPHSSLRKMAARAGVLPTPQAMYLWGLEHITGLQTSSLSESDIQKMLMPSRPGSIGQGIVRFKGMHYEPANAAARRLARASTHKYQSITLKVDETVPTAVYVPQSKSAWAEFSLTHGGLNRLRGTTLAEQESLEYESLLLWSIADQDSRAGRVIDARIRAQLHTSPLPLPEHVDPVQVKQKRFSETRVVQSALRGEFNGPGISREPTHRTGDESSSREDVLTKLIDKQIKKQLGDEK